jgi:hypothetical protein
MADVRASPPHPHLVCEHLPNVYHIQNSVQVIIVKSLTYIHEILRMRSVNPDNTRLYHIHVDFFLWIVLLLLLLLLCPELSLFLHMEEFLMNTSPE